MKQRGIAHDDVFFGGKQRTAHRDLLQSGHQKKIVGNRDTFGEFMPAYGLAKSAFIGGSLAPLGGQNFLEALVSGIIPIIGPWWDNFAWVGREIIDAGLLRVAEDWKQVADLLLEDLAGPLPRKDVMDAALQFIQARRGGTEMACRRIIAALENT